MASRLDVDIVANDRTEPGIKSTKRKFESIEQQAARSAAAMTRNLDRGTVELARSTDRQAAMTARSIASFERQAQLFGTRGLQRMRAQGSMLLRQAGTDEAAIQRVLRARQTLEANAARAGTAIRGPSIAATGDGFVGLAAKLAVAGAGFKKLILDTAGYAARTETLQVVTNRLAISNGLNMATVNETVEAVRKQGITTQEAHGTVQKMIVAQLDLGRATDIARLSQDAAVIAGIDSSQALQGIIHGIVTRQPEVLRTYGIIVDFERRYNEERKIRGRDLTQNEKLQVAFNEVLLQGSKITGSYEAAMGTAGKQAGSLTRLIAEATNAVGQQFIPAYSTAVQLLGAGAGHIQKNAESYAGLAKLVTLAAVAYASFKAAVFLLPAGLAAMANPIGLTVAALAALTAGLVLGRDKFNVQRDAVEAHVASLERQRSELGQQGLAWAEYTRQIEETRGSSSLRMSRSQPLKRTGGDSASSDPLGPAA